MFLYDGILESALLSSLLLFFAGFSFGRGHAAREQSFQEKKSDTQMTRHLTQG